ncbi:MAG: Rrf2 family transcriptional regulator [Chlorobi bacterium]|nr:Rrf2 family transcriptional regulator [Chlorobiota bacterium]
MFYLFNKEYDYAIRICGFLAGAPEKKFSIRELSKKLLITLPFATKIIYKLKISGIVITERGKYGGVLLAKSPENITLFEILTAIGLLKKISECITEDKFCPLPAPCKIHSFFMDEEEIIFTKLKSLSIHEFKFTETDFK